MQASLDKALGRTRADRAPPERNRQDAGRDPSRLKAVEAGLAEAQAERTRLSTALDEANQKHLDEMNVQNSRFEALQARASLTENLLEEARQTLMARADEIRTFERRVVETSTAHDNAGEKLEPGRGGARRARASDQGSRAGAHGARRTEPDARQSR